jgi:hypothetical protein
MTFKLPDRTYETTNTTGTGTVSLLGAEDGYQSFAAGVGNGNTTYYCISNDTQWEIGLGTYTTSGSTLSRTTVISSSNSNALVSFSAGPKNVFVVAPSEKFPFTDDLEVTTIPSTGALLNPYGTTAERPATPSRGMQRWNSTIDCLEVYNGSEWINLVPFTVPSSYLVVAGGGGGSGSGAGGGGAGGLLTGSATLVPTVSYTITVGAGGAAGAGVPGSVGANSIISTVATAIGGGGGGSGGTGTANANPSSGGSGGGGGGFFFGNVVAGAAGTSGQGFAGGSGGSATTQNGGGGGGGASEAGYAGQFATLALASQGGAGVSSSITGSPVFYAGGGGGGEGSVSGTSGLGGTGGGGNGSTISTSRASTAGTANTGGGGGGGSRDGGTGQSGGSGVVIISYASPQKFTGGTVTTAGANTVHTFTSSGTLAPI